MKRYVLLYILLVILIKSFAQSKGSFSVKQYNMDDGLAHTRTKNIIQDSKGQIWISTWNGIDQFNGYNFRNFKSYPHDKVKLNNNRIEGLSVNAAGNIWLRTYGSQVFLFNSKLEVFEDIFSDKQHPLVNDIKSLANGATWITAQNHNLYRIDDRNYTAEDGVRVFGPTTYPYLGNTIHNIFLDSEGDEWVLSNKGTFTYGKKKVSNNMPFHFITELNGTIYFAARNGYLATYRDGKLAPFELPFELTDIFRLHKLNPELLAIVTADQIIIYHTQTKRFSRFVPPAGQEFIFSEKTFYDSHGRIWAFASGRQLVCYDTKRGEQHTLPYPELSGLSLTPSAIFFLHEDEHRQLWILLPDGVLCAYNPEQRKLDLAYYTPLSGQLTHYAVSAREYLVDSHKNLWLSTTDGIHQLSFREKSYERIAASADGEVRSMFKDDQDRMWIGKKNGTLALYNKANDYLGNLTSAGTIVRDKKAVFGANVYCFIQDHEGQIWLGTRDQGLFILRPRNAQTYQVTNYKPTSDPYSIGSESIFSLYQDAQKRVWIGGYGGGLNLVEKKTDGTLRFVHAGNRLKNYPVDQCGLVRYVYQSKNGTMLVGTSNGLITFSGTFQKPEHIGFFHNASTADRTDCLSNNEVLHISQDRRQQIYVSTFSGGISITTDSPNLLSDKIKFKNINRTNGLISDLSLSVIEDLKGYLWIASVNVLSRFNPTNEQFDHFSKENLGLTPLINEAAPIRDPDGNIIFGTTDGALRVLTDRMLRSTFVPPIVFSAIRIQRQDIQEERNVDENGILMLAEDERNISVSFAALDYTNIKSIQYAYRLKGTDSTWVYLGHNRSASFVELPAGRHTLEVKSTNSDGVWVENVASIQFYITPTFWETGFSWVIYILALALLVLLIVLIVSYIMQLRKRVDVEQQLTGLKLNFFTDISHELRTPLTLIASPIEEVLQHEKLSSSGRAYLQTAKQNTHRMLRLINQILDFRKIQHQKMKVYLEQADVAALLEKTFNSFSPIARQKQINYTLEQDITSTPLYVDVDKVEKILFNLLSNAFKYTPAGRQIAIRATVEDGKLVLMVTDEGSGFDMGKAKGLFERYETNDADPSISSGIGLALVHELVDLLHGRIAVDSEKGKGSAFTVRLPIAYEAFSGDPNIELKLGDGVAEQAHTTPIVDTAPETTKRTSILVIEDNDELRDFIRSILEQEYDILEASDGRKGLEITLDKLPDIVVSDVMMPDMDGVAYLEAVKNNVETSHIPVILLTAKSALDDKIKGMEYGADDYITKPFHASYLKAKIASLLKQRELLREYYLAHNSTFEPTTGTAVKSSPSWGPSVPKVTAYDDEFIRNVIQGIEDNIENTNFKIDDLVAGMNMSRAVFYRKIKAIVGLSPVDFVKKIRVKRAAQLLETGQFTVAEVAYQSGFSTSQYLSKVFKEMMGCTPTEYLKNLKNK
ncbi:response regulator [Sphingobacterium olei]|uniref:histidine kinase n=1 Tax=Sphingobacterium olei TaxID=2571155 RepID=A0A4U0P338_9SPHI|nr:hybrid sensor histidine kinase/response regulator transcription factor [Sphingobacterium olei]TJZ61766.1 response regulator [Sphingobacterium olei]